MSKVVSFSKIMDALEKDERANSRMIALDDEYGTVTAGSYVRTRLYEPDELPAWLVDEMYDELGINSAVVVHSYNDGFSGSGREAELVGYTILDGHVVPVVIYWDNIGIVAGSADNVWEVFHA